MKRILVTALLFLSGCAAGPDFQRPAAPAVDRYTREASLEKTSAADVPGGEEQRFLAERDIPADWWTLFQSPQLNSLVERSLKANPTVQAGQAALRQARELVRAQQGFYYPAVQGTYSASRQRESQTLSPSLSAGNDIFSLHTAQLSVSYAPDVFGLNRRQVEALEAQAGAQRFQLEATYLTLTSNVVAAAIQEASLRAQLVAARDIVAINSKSLDLLRRQFAVGAVAGMEVAAQEAALAQAEQALPPLQKQLEQTRNLLGALAGRLPAEQPDEAFELSALHLPQDLPVSLPSRLVEQRPDVRAAEEQLHSASAGIGVATQFGQMFASGNPFWSVAAGVSQTVFAGGTLLARKRAAQAAFDQAAAQYRATVIGAFQNTADALYALQADADALRAAVNSERASRRSLELVQKQLQVGQVNYLALLASQQTYQQAVINLAQARASRFADTAALFQALGGGWWNRAAPATPAD